MTFEVKMRIMKNDLNNYSNTTEEAKDWDEFAAV